MIADLIKKFGSLALVFFQRAKENLLFTDEKMKGLGNQLHSCFRMQSDEVDSRVFVQIILNKLSITLDKILIDQDKGTLQKVFRNSYMRTKSQYY